MKIRTECILLIYWRILIYAVGIAQSAQLTRLRAEPSGVLITVEARKFIFTQKFRLALQPTQHPIPWTPGAFSS
jgi:hypothetical protein